MPLIRGDHVLAHIVGDYFLQSDWMALGKTQRWLPLLAHILTYTAAFAFPMFMGWWEQDLAALAIIGLTHAAIDRWSLTKYLSWGKNFLAPPGSNPPFQETVMGYGRDRPFGLVVWLHIIVDNTMHLIINGMALGHM